jgi:Tol biopolymer transport system component
VLYRADETRLASEELHSVPFDGSLPNARISLPGAVNKTGVDPDFKLGPDGATVVYRDNSQGPFELYAGSALGGSPPVKLSGPLQNQGNVGNFRFSEDGTRVVYEADAFLEPQYEIFVVPTDGSSAALKVSGTLPNKNRSAVNGSLTADNAWVVFLSDKDIDDVAELYSVPSDASAAPTKLHPSITGQFQDIQAYAIQPNGNWVVYWGDPDIQGQYELFRVLADGSQPAVRVSGFLSATADVQQNTWRITQDGQWVLYLADSNVDELFELFFAPITGPGFRLLSFPLTPSTAPKNVLPGPGIRGSRSVAFD